MSQENVEFAEALLAAAGGMDKQAMLAALPELIPQICTPDIEWAEDPSAPTRVSSAATTPSVGPRERWLEQLGRVRRAGGARSWTAAIRS